MSLQSSSAGGLDNGHKLYQLNQSTDYLAQLISSCSLSLAYSLICLMSDSLLLDIMDET
jgi:hypothetical protein